MISQYRHCQIVESYLQASDRVQTLILVLGQNYYTLAELMQFMNLTYRAIFQKNYLNSKIEIGLMELTIPDKPKIPKQRYKLNKIVKISSPMTFQFKLFYA